MKIAGHEMPARQQSDRSACAYPAIWSAELAFGSRQDVIDFTFHRLERQPARRLRQDRQLTPSKYLRRRIAP